jgi:hypothetical protein
MTTNTESHIEGIDRGRGEVAASARDSTLVHLGNRFWPTPITQPRLLEPVVSLKVHVGVVFATLGGCWRAE